MIATKSQWRGLRMRRNAQRALFSGTASAVLSDIRQGLSFASEQLVSAFYQLVQSGSDLALDIVDTAHRQGNSDAALQTLFRSSAFRQKVIRYIDSCAQQLTLGKELVRDDEILTKLHEWRKQGETADSLQRKRLEKASWQQLISLEQLELLKNQALSIQKADNAMLLAVQVQWTFEQGELEINGELDD